MMGRNRLEDVGGNGQLFNLILRNKMGFVCLVIGNSGGLLCRCSKPRV